MMTTRSIALAPAVMVGILWAGAPVAGLAAGIDLGTLTPPLKNLGTFDSAGGLADFDGSNFSFFGGFDPGVAITSNGTDADGFTIGFNSVTPGLATGSGTGVAVTSMSGSLEVVFELDPGAAYPGLTGSFVLATFSDLADFLGSPVDPLSDVFSGDATVVLSNLAPEGAAAVPLPAGLPLLLSAVAGLALLRRRS